ncbi:hypothetical protein WJX79_004356 [Trebouxia sp. C0005]
MAPKQVDISTLDPRQLQSIHEQIENEINNLVQSSVALQRAAGEYGNSGRALQQLSEQKEDQPMLLPLTSAVYVSGKLASHESILLEIGTGYYAERSPQEGVDYCKRKVNMLKENLDKIGQMVKDKQQQLTMMGKWCKAKYKQLSLQQALYQAVQFSVFMGDPISSKV